MLENQIDKCKNVFKTIKLILCTWKYFYGLCSAQEVFFIRILYCAYCYIASSIITNWKGYLLWILIGIIWPKVMYLFSPFIQRISEFFIQKHPFSLLVGNGGDVTEISVNTLTADLGIKFIMSLVVFLHLQGEMNDPVDLVSRGDVEF